MNELSNKQILFGKDFTEKIVNVEVIGDEAYIFQEDERGVFYHKRDFTPWLLSSVEDDFYFEKLKGKLHYKYLKKFNNRDLFKEAVSENKNYWAIQNFQENFMLLEGITFFKNMNFEDLSILSFDIETSGLLNHEDSKLLVISSVYKKNNKIEKKIFSLDEFKSEVKLIESWVKWVNEKDPSCIIGYNIYNFDFPFLKKVMDKNNSKILLGRNKSELRQMEFKSKFRMNSGAHFEYNSFRIFGREIIDMYFVAQRYDLDKKYNNYRLKEIAKLEGITRRNRQEYDASLIGKKWIIPTEREKIKKYCLADSEETYKLYLKMIPSFFEFAKYISLPFSQYINRSSTSQLNNLLIRNYIHNKHSIPNKTFIKQDSLKGGKTVGNPGIHNNVLKLDVSSLYMSIVNSYQLHDEKKDPLKIFPFLVSNFIKKRLELKELRKVNPDLKNIDKMYKDFLNKGCYGFLATRGYLFNSPILASEITERGRNILDKALIWAKENNYYIINADTDGISFCRNDELFIDKKEKESILNSFKENFIEGIRWEEEDCYIKIISLKSKNYAFIDKNNNIIKKGSSLKSKGKEEKITQLIDEILKILFLSDKENVFNELLILYKKYIKEASNIKKIDKWCKKKVVTERTFNTKNNSLLKIISSQKFKEGDDFFYFYKDSNNLELLENFDGEYSDKKLKDKINKTFLIFEDVVDFSLFPFIL